MAGFGEIVGHEQIIAHLKNAVAMDKISHAYIISGPESCGKRLLAEAFAMALQCETLQEKRGQSAGYLRADAVEACMECRSCKQAVGKNHPDILYVTHAAEDTISVNDIRKQVNADVCIRPYSSRYKIYIIDEAEKMNVQAQNALLKTIEEPPAYAVILLLTTNAEAFLPTIRSRCITLECRAVKDQKIRDFLMRRCQIPDYRADICAAFAQGNVGRAVLLASSDNFNEMKDFTLQIVRRIGEIPNYELLETVKRLKDIREDANDFLDFLVLWYRDVLLYKASGQENLLIFKDQAYEVARQAETAAYPGIQNILEEIETAKRRIRAKVNPDLTLELLLMAIKSSGEMSTPK